MIDQPDSAGQDLPDSSQDDIQRQDGAGGGRARAGRGTGAMVARLARFAGAAAAVLAGIWLASIWWMGQSGAREYHAQDYQTAQDRYSLAGSFMVAERWKAWFGDGTAVLAADNPARAEELLKQALSTVPAAKQCVVRINLSLAQERQGDQADARGDQAGATEFYTTALETLRAGECPVLDDTAAEAAERLELKLQDPDGVEPDNPSEGGDNPDDQSGQDEGSGEEGDQGDEDEGGGSPSAKPDDGESGSSGGASGSSKPSESLGQSGSPGADASEEDLNDRLDRLREQNRQGQMERQDGQVDPNRTGRYWDRPVW
ncbi:MAG: hypothetical protein LBS27_02145 [Bifidobacteriaceae bacterium]|jgi:tetratricopeptide (TPR) repeat protein|nr:hypothetical protein [Bifidobacteriaceae bacterium]